MSVLTAIVFVLEMALSAIPSVQLTFLLFMLYSRVLGGKKTALIIVAHVVLDTMFFGGLLSMYSFVMIFGYMFIPIIMNTLLRKTKNIFILAIFSGLFGIIFAWSFIPPTMILYGVPLIPYLIADIPFTGVLVINNFITTMLLFNPLEKITREYFLGEIQYTI